MPLKGVGRTPPVLAQENPLHKRPPRLANGINNPMAARGNPLWLTTGSETSRSAAKATSSTILDSAIQSALREADESVKEGEHGHEMYVLRSRS